MSAAGPCHILVLDDNVDVAQGLAEILELSGYKVTLAHNGQSAVLAFDNDSFDLGIFDIRMPGMNGVQAFLEIKRRHPEAHIIMMSGYADQELIDSALNNGALGLLPKPFEPEELLSRVEKLREGTTAVS
jgi:DNA-binding response OmpR family regulator